MELSEEPSAYRWVIVAAAAMILALSMGSIVNGMSAFVVPMQEAYGWQRAEISLINVSGIIGMAAGGVIMGRQADRIGTRPVVLFGAASLGTCYLGASFADALWQYYALMFAAGFLGAAAIFSPIMAAVGNWFPVGAGLAIGIASAGQALGQGGVPYLSTLLIKEFGISTAIAITGVSMLMVLIPLTLLLKQPERREQASFSDQAHMSGGYLSERIVIPTMCIAVFLCCTCMSVPLMHLVPLIQDQGIPLEQAGEVMLLMLLVGIVGRVAFGKLADVIGALPAYMTATAWMTVLVYGFIQLERLETFQLYAALYGFGYAGVMTGVLTSTASLTRPSRRGFAIGVVGIFGWLGHANGGFMGGYLFDVFGSYSYSYGVAAVAGALNLLVISTLMRKARDPMVNIAVS